MMCSWEFKTENHNIAFGIYKNKSCDSDETDKIEAVSNLLVEKLLIIISS